MSWWWRWPNSQTKPTVKVARFPPSRPPVTQLPTPWVVEPQVQAVVPRRQRKKKLSSKEVAKLVDDVVDGGKSLTEARQQIASQLGKEFAAVERAHQRQGRHKSLKNRKNKSSKNPKRKNR
jgi:hypothetical protein